MDHSQLTSIIESLIFVADEPITESALLLLLEQDGITKTDIETALENIRQKFNLGIELKQVAGGYQFRTRSEMAPYIQRLNIPKPSKLTQPALETLAIIAYRQPIVRSEIEEIRGVDTGGVLRTLLERGFIKIMGKRDEPGNPLIYATTSKFLELFELNSLRELPTLREYEELEKERYGSILPQEPQNNTPLLEGIDTTPVAEKWTGEDNKLLDDLDSNIKQLRRLERDIFPKPIETVVAVPNPEGGTSEIQTDNPPPEDTGTDY